jgi:hypothetical protein
MWDRTEGIFPNFFGNAGRHDAVIFQKALPFVFENGCYSHVLQGANFCIGLFFVSLI